MLPAKRWQIAPPLTPAAERTLAAFPYPLRQILFNRGYASEAEARAFLLGEAEFDLFNTYPLGTAEAVERILHARRKGETVIIYGDYDVDGVTATVLLVEALSRLGLSVRGYIPNRFDEGYGLNMEALQDLKEGGAALVITVDCGIRSLAEAEYAREIGLELIITDHHHPGTELPAARAVINPRQAADDYPEKYLAGVGLAWKLAQALYGATAEKATDAALELVALGTVADLAPLCGENRALVRIGLRQLAQSGRAGIHALAKVARLNLRNVTATDIGFILGPRLNAAGRLESALAAYELLLTQDIFQAGLLAQKLESQNRERQALTRATQEAAERIALQESTDELPLLLFAVHPEFNIGVVGLAAARLVERHYRPAIVARQDAETTRGSCRSIPEFHITEALDACADLLIHHGGHAVAAGFTLHNRNLPEFMERMHALAAQALEGKELRPTVVADAEVPLSIMGREVWKQLQLLQPTGYGNPEATFVSRGVHVRQVRRVGNDGQHLKLTLQDEHGVTWDGIGFRLGDMAEKISPGKTVDILYTLEINEYNGRTSLQLNVKDIRT